MKDKYGSLNLLVNASGILSIPNVLQPGKDATSFFGFTPDILDPDVGFHSSNVFGIETTLNKVQRASLLLAYEVNAVGPILVIKVF